MSDQKYLKGECQHCGGHLEFSAEAAGTTAACPHCGQATDLFLAVPEHKTAVPVKTIVWTAITVLILIGGLIGVMIALKRAQRLAAANKIAPAARPVAATPPDPFAQAGFHVSAITLEDTPGSSLVYAVGTVRNATNRRRFGVKVELELFDADGKSIGAAKDYQATIEPQAEWKFKALVVESKVASAKITSIKEDQ